MSIIPEPIYRVRAQLLTTGVNDPVAMVFDGDGAGNLDRQATSQLAFLDLPHAGSRWLRVLGSLPDSEIFGVNRRSGKGTPTRRQRGRDLASVDRPGRRALLNIYARPTSACAMWTVERLPTPRAGSRTS